MSNSQETAHTSDSQPESFEIDWWTMLTDPEYLSDPYSELKRIRELAPVHFDPASGIFFVLGHREFNIMAKAREMGRDIRFWTNSWNSPKNKKGDPKSYEMFREFQPQMINSNPPDHKRMRGVYEKAFLPSGINRHRSVIEAECQRLLETIPVDSTFDFITTFANPLPHHISLDLFEIPRDMGDKIQQWIEALSWLGNIITTPDQKHDAQIAQAEFKSYMRDHFYSRPREQSDGFMDLARGAFEDGTIDEEETLNELIMLVSGNKTTPSLLGNGMLTLLRHPEQFEKLRADRSLMRSAIEEMLRFEPGSSIIPRAAIQDFQCADVLIPKELSHSVSWEHSVEIQRASKTPTYLTSAD